MNEKKTKTKTKPDTLTLDYDLYSLPTAQHKAGLVGLMLMIESLKQRKLSPLPEITSQTDTETKIQITEENLQLIFDDLFDAEWIEVASKSPWRGKNPKRIDEITVIVDEKEKIEKRLIYDVFQPKGSFLKVFYPDNCDNWLKLWRDMLWNTLRGKPTTRNVYEERADHKQSSEAGKVWKQLIKSHEMKTKGEILTDSVASSQFIGAQDVNAERVPFVGTVEENFLLNFWIIPSLIYSIRPFNEKGEYKNEESFVFIIPEPSKLVLFLDDICDLLKSIDTKTQGYRPKAALIDIPQEGGLEYLYSLAHHRVNRQSIRFSLASVEIYHLVKRGNNIHTLTTDRIVSNQFYLDEYENLKKESWNPIYKSVRILNLLQDNPWYTGFDSVFGQYPWEFFIYNKEKTPKYIHFFGIDVQRKFKNLKGEKEMENETKEESLPLLIYGLIQEYVRRRSEEKSGETYDEFKKKKNEKGYVDYPLKYREAVEKVCSDAFLAMRGRREKDFIEYFTGTICSVPQWIGKKEDYMLVSNALIEKWDDVKTFSMLALSACSTVGRSQDRENVKGE